ncbi:MAG TPA: hypothetical protein VGL68_07260 [Solirubrobacteraceae bacterium]
MGLAKNTGKTVALAALLRELEEQGRRVGVTSVGRDGEARDVIDRRIEKPSIVLAAGSLVATTDSLLRASGRAHELVEQTGIRTPLGQVLIARLTEPGAIEVAGPSAAADIRAVSDAMLAYGAERVLIDGAIDRRAASSPAVSDGLIMSTGAVLSEDIEEVVAKTKAAVDLVRLPRAPGTNGPDTIVLPPRFALTCEEPQIGALLDAHPSTSRLITGGALPGHFLDALARAAHRRRRALTVVAEDPTKVFLTDRGPSWYGDNNIDIQVAQTVVLATITVNPVAPQSHRFDTARLQALLRDAITGVPIFDIREPSPR